MSELVLVANAGDGTISTMRLHREPERLEPLATSGVGPGCGTFAIDGDLVYAAYKGDPPGVATLRLDRESGELTEISRRAVESSMSYLSLGHDGAVLLGASYGGGFGMTWPVSPAGEVGEPVSRVDYPNAHCIIAAGSHAYLVSLGADLIAQYALGMDGTLAPLDPASVAAPAGSGPRHLILDGANAYAMTEFSGEAIHFEVGSDGALARRESVAAVDPSAGLTHSRLGADPVAEHLIWGADLHRAGPWLLCSERSASTIATLPVEDGRLGSVVAFAQVPAQPRGFGVTGDGRYVVAVGEKSTVAALLRVGEDGRLTECGSAQVGSGANWVRIIS